MPKESNKKDHEFDGINLVNIVPVRIHPFADDCEGRFAYAPVGEDKVLLLSVAKKRLDILRIDLIKTKGQRKLLLREELNLGIYLDQNHWLDLVL